MGIYDKYILPRLLNVAMKSPEFGQLRRRLVPLAEGRVLELGIGSGLNLPFYQKGVRIVGVDPSLELQQYAREVARESGTDVEFIADSAENLPLEDNSFDSAVITWTLCTIPDQHAALAEVRRVLKPGGKLIFAEHGRSPDPAVERWQHRLNPAWRVIGGGCNLNRRPDESLLRAGFVFDELEEGYLEGPRWATYNYRGVACLA